MGVNIIVRKGSGGRVSDSELSESLAKRIDREQAQEKAGYKDRMREIRAHADKNVKGGGDFKPTAVYDMASYMRMEQTHGKGIMSDPTFRREYLRDNPECKLD
tara:strand:- start:274 stop:582 length:309 start_codon:yes stop_codon:yes gene_type:complete